MKSGQQSRRSGPEPLPVVGKAFNYDNNETNKTELVIFLKPAVFKERWCVTNFSPELRKQQMSLLLEALKKAALSRAKPI